MCGPGAGAEAAGPVPEAGRVRSDYFLFSVTVPFGLRVAVADVT